MIAAGISDYRIKICKCPCRPAGGVGWIAPLNEHDFRELVTLGAPLLHTMLTIMAGE